MYYTESNVAKCCAATICTECYLQIKPQKDRHTPCPFCNNPKMVVVVQKEMDEGDVARREEEEQRVIEATIRSRANERHGEGRPASDEEVAARPGAAGPAASEIPGSGSFGASLEHYNRARALSASSNGSVPSDPGTPVHASGNTDDCGDASILSLAMSPADRHALEVEMRAQLSHETHRRVEAEADEARIRHAQEWYGSRAAAGRGRVREARVAELTGLLEGMAVRNNSGEREDNRREGRDLLARGGDEGTGRNAGLGRLLRAMESSARGRGSSSRSSLEDLMRLEAAFFLGSMEDDDETGRGQGAQRPRDIHPMTGLLGRSEGLLAPRNLYEGDGDGEAAGSFAGLDQFTQRPSSRYDSGFGRRAGGRAGHRLAGNRGMSSTHLDTAELLMRGVSEEEQLAMAIALSMQDAQEQPRADELGLQAGANAAGEGRGQVEGSGGDVEDSSSSGLSTSSDSSMEGAEDQDQSDAVNTRSFSGEGTSDANYDAEDEREATFTDPG